MSWEAVQWALEQPVGKATDKFVLVAMAHCVNGNGGGMLCWPSTQHLADTTHLDRKTVLDCLRRLRESGFIRDTGERRGATGQVAVYSLNSPNNGTVKSQADAYFSGDEQSANSTEIGTGPKTGTVPVFPINSTGFPYEQSQFSLRTVPKTGHGTSKEQGKNKEGTSKEKHAPAGLDDIDQSLLTDYLAVRKAKKAGPLTATAVAALRREAEKAGISVEDAIRCCCEWSWQGFNAGWYLDRIGKGVRPVQPAKQQPGRHAAAAATIFNFGQDQGEVIDV